MWSVLWKDWGWSKPVITETAKALLDKALKRRDELRLESEALDTLINTYRKIEELRHETGDKRVDQLDLWHGGSRRAYQSAQVSEMLEAARRIILAERRPMKRGELVKRLEARGFVILGADKNKVFGTNLWRSGKFKHLPKQGYWPSDVPFSHTDLL
jgi:hypothetical protein